MKEKVLSIFNFLDKNKIDYLLLRPINLNSRFNDIDLIIDELNLKRLMMILKKSDYEVYYMRTNYKKSIKIIVNDIVLDIQRHVSFLSHKSLILKKIPAYSTLELINGSIIIPKNRYEQLFTLWTYRLILDKSKKSPNYSLLLYKSLFSSRWKRYLKTKIFFEWTAELVGEKNSQDASKLLTLFFEEGMDPSNKHIRTRLRLLLLKKRPTLYLKVYFDNLVFKVLWQTGCYHKKNTLNSI